MTMLVLQGGSAGSANFTLFAFSANFLVENQIVCVVSGNCDHSFLIFASASCCSIRIQVICWNMLDSILIQFLCNWHSLCELSGILMLGFAMAK